jgi:hypothetical protein
VSIHFAIAGLDPAIHALCEGCMDARVTGVPATPASRGARPAHDSFEVL